MVKKTPFVCVDFYSPVYCFYGDIMVIFFVSQIRYIRGIQESGKDKISG